MLFASQVFCGYRRRMFTAPSEPQYAFTINRLMKTPADLAKMETHGCGNDSTSKRRRRDDATHRALAYSLGENGKFVGGLDSVPGFGLRAAYKRHLQQHDAGLRKSAPIAHHMLVGVSPEWIAETGDPHDPHNPRVRKLVVEAWKWAETNLGGVFAFRYDIDEDGSSIVDVFVAPIHKSRGRNIVSTNKSLAALKRKHGRAIEFSAVQDSWAEYAQEHLDPTLQRGKLKAETGVEHDTPERYKARVLAAKRSIAEATAEAERQQKAANAARRETAAAKANTRRLQADIAAQHCEIHRLDQLLKKKPWLSGEPHAGEVWQPATGYPPI